MKTDLAKIFPLRAKPGLYRYLVQSNGGVVVESLIDGKRKWMSQCPHDIFVGYICRSTQTNEELRLQDILTRMKEFLKQDQAPAPGSDTAAWPLSLKRSFPNTTGTVFILRI